MHAPLLRLRWPSEALAQLGRHEEVLDSTREVISESLQTQVELQCQFTLAVAEHAYVQDRAKFGYYAEAEDMLSSCLNRLYALGAQQTPLCRTSTRDAGVPSRVDSCVHRLDRDDDADQLEADIAHVVKQ